MKVSFFVTCLAAILVVTSQTHAITSSVAVQDDATLFTNSSINGSLANNMGGRSNMFIGDINPFPNLGSRHAIVRFDLSGEAVEDSIVDSASVTLTYQGAFSAAQNNIADVYRIREAHGDWVEGTSGSGVEAGSSSWRSRQDGVAGKDWGQLGAQSTTEDRYGAALGTVALGGGTADNDELVFNLTGGAGQGGTLTSMLREWKANGATSAGLLFVPRTDEGVQFAFDTNETAGGSPAVLSFSTTPLTRTTVYTEDFAGFSGNLGGQNGWVNQVGNDAGIVGGAGSSLVNGTDTSAQITNAFSIDAKALEVVFKARTRMRGLNGNFAIQTGMMANGTTLFALGNEGNTGNFLFRDSQGDVVLLGNDFGAHSLTTGHGFYDMIFTIDVRSGLGTWQVRRDGEVDFITISSQLDLDLAGVDLDPSTWDGVYLRSNQSSNRIDNFDVSFAVGPDIPEPASASLLLLATAGLVRRRRRSNA